jgi:STE24 endopeptidase
VIDGSKRSTHSNAFFTGFGRFRRIVLFDTLIEQLEPSEIEAVLAHEIGHYKKGHIIKMIAMNFIEMFITFAIMGWLSASEWFYIGFGLTEAQGFAPVSLMLSLFAGLFTFWFTPITNMFSRKHEYEADAFASNITKADDLKSALRKLHKKNLGNLTPHPIYSAFYYSHPTLLERERALEAISSKSVEKQNEEK